MPRHMQQTPMMGFWEQTIPCDRALRCRALELLLQRIDAGQGACVIDTIITAAKERKSRDANRIKLSKRVGAWVRQVKADVLAAERRAARRAVARLIKAEGARK